ncbi:hypothetical protein [Streptomyces sp. NPDC008125]|uniref:hypothetical protein n=1 Tax=Streptomyces sp. NPDC008125 TaxID=3364811 RepID=UPI0036EC867F
MLQRAVAAAPAKVVPLRRPAAQARSAAGHSAAVVAPLPAPAAHPSPAAPMPVVQRLFGKHSKGGTRTTPPRSGSSAIGSLAAAAAATVAGPFMHTAPPVRPPSPPPYTPAGPPPPYAPAAASGSYAPPPYDPPPEYRTVPDNTFDPKELTEFQLDALAHQLIGRITRLIRTELRLDRERIGKLRDPRR